MFSPVMPLDRGNGLAMRAAFFLDAYAQRYDVDLVVAPVAGGGEINAFSSDRARRIEVLDVRVTDGHFRLAKSVRDVPTRLEALRQYGKPSLAASIGPAAHSLDAMLAGDDYVAVHVFRLYLAELAWRWLNMDGATRPRLILDCDENDAEVHRRLAVMERRRGDLQRANEMDVEAEGFTGLISKYVPQFDLVLAASRRELTSLGATAASQAVIPNAVIPPAASQRRSSPSFTILFVGSLGYAPNADAIAWFVSRVWRRLQREMNFKVRLLIVGSHPSLAIRRLDASRGITVTGAVADVAPFYQEADLVVAPIRAGGGTRIKIIEAAAYRLPIVGTRVASEGTTFKPDIDMLVADNEASFLNACLRIANQRSTAKRVADRAYMRFKQDYSSEYWRRRIVRWVTDDGASGGT